MLILFDIDGTLLLSHGAGRRAMTAAGRRLVGPAFTLEGVEVSGRIDPLIWADAAAQAGVTDVHGRHVEFRRVYAEILAADLRGGVEAWLLPGVEALLARLASIEGLTLGLLTGNYPETGRLKLEAAGLDADGFTVAAWGSDGAHRRELPRVAMRRYEERLGRPIPAERVVVIGDTPHDVDCARASGCAAIAVATGPGFTVDDLRTAGPDLLVDDLTDTEALVAWITRRAGTAAPGSGPVGTRHG